MTYQIRQPEVLYITDTIGNRYYGADQEWYQQSWQRKAGCGPTTCSHLMWYLARTRVDAAELTKFQGSSRDGFLKIMEDVWNYVTPTPRGVNTTKLFTDGAKEYSRQKGVDLMWEVLDVPALLGDRPSEETLIKFCKSAFANDRPVAFLNLSNGALKNLDNWHWVTLVAFDEDEKTAVMYDAGERKVIDLGKWLKTTILGGGLVSLDIVYQKPEVA